MFLLSVKPFIGSEEEFFKAIVILPTETYEEGVWSAFSTNSGGILCCVIARLISLRKVSLHSSNTPRGTGDGLSAGEIASSINRLHPGRFGLKSPQSTYVVAVTSASAVTLTTQEFTKPPLLQILLRREISLLSSSRRLGGRPRVSCGIAMIFASVFPFRLSSFNHFSYACLKVLTVLSFRAGSSFPK